MRVLVHEREGARVPFVTELLAPFGEVWFTGEVEPSELVSAVGRTAVELVLIARAAWNEEDTELCRRIQGPHLHVPLLALSGPTEGAHRSAALRAGVDDFMSIPFEVDELVARGYALVRRASSGSRHARAGVFSVDFAKRQICVDGMPLPLTLKEYDLLAMLIERAGDVVTRRELAGQPAAGSEIESNAVDVHMSRIRDKLGKRASHVETVRGLGYRLRSG